MIEIHSGFIGNGPNLSFAGSLKNSLILGTGVTYRFNPNLEIGTDISHEHLEGNDLTSMWEASFAFRLILPAHYIRPFFSLGSGIYFVNTHSSPAVIMIDPAFGSHSFTSSKDRNSSQKHSKGLAAFGLGFEIPLNKRFQFRVDARWTGTFDGSYSFIPVTAAFQVAI
ncbi:MAG TPA: hypothetical protein VKA08_15345 [Balneolales bacterium]|nr:hypothetical protein [Balneolales bacterium]